MPKSSIPPTRIKILAILLPVGIWLLSACSFVDTLIIYPDGSGERQCVMELSWQEAQDFFDLKASDHNSAGAQKFCKDFIQGGKVDAVNSSITNDGLVCTLVLTFDTFDEMKIVFPTNASRDTDSWPFLAPDHLEYNFEDGEISITIGVAALLFDYQAEYDLKYDFYMILPGNIGSNNADDSRASETRPDETVLHWKLIDTGISPDNGPIVEERYLMAKTKLLPTPSPSPSPTTTITPTVTPTATNTSTATLRPSRTPIPTDSGILGLLPRSNTKSNTTNGITNYFVIVGFVIGILSILIVILILALRRKATTNRE